MVSTFRDELRVSPSAIDWTSDDLSPFAPTSSETSVRLAARAPAKLSRPPSLESRRESDVSDALCSSTAAISSAPFASKDAPSSLSVTSREDLDCSAANRVPRPWRPRPSPPMSSSTRACESSTPRPMSSPTSAVALFSPMASD
eukprot:Amastigsp_a843053_21.p3 type:complete len:144 gc:universal Amastigsp_a843053_21:992-1423(+)